MPGTATSGGISFGAGSIMTLTPQDADAIAKECSRRQATVAPVVRARTQVIYGNKNWVAHYIYGTTPAFLDVREWTDMDEGEIVHRPGRPQRQQGLPGGPTIVQGAVRRAIAHRQGSAGPERGLQGHRRPELQGRQHDGHGPGRHPAGPLDDHQVPRRRHLRSAAPTRAATTSATYSHLDVESQPVNTLNQLYPNTTTSLYPTPSTIEQADLPQPIRFANVDQILAAARSHRGDPRPPSSRSPICCGSATTSSPASPNDFTVRDMTEMTKAMSSTTDYDHQARCCAWP